MALGALIKAPALVYGLPLVAWLWKRRGRTAAREWRYWLYLPVALVPPAVWYAHAKTLQTESGISYFHLGSPLQELWQSWVDPDFYYRLFVQRPFDTVACPVLSALAVGALVFAFRRTPGWVLLMFLAAVVFVFIGGGSAAWHVVYSSVFVPPMALLGGLAVQFLQERLRTARAFWLLVATVAATCAAYGVVRTRHWFASEGATTGYVEAKSAVDSHLAPHELIAVFSDGGPPLFWHLDRKGWLVGRREALSWLSEERPSALRAVALDRNSKNGGLEEAEEAVRSSPLGFQRVFHHSTVDIWVAPRHSARPEW